MLKMNRSILSSEQMLLGLVVVVGVGVPMPTALGSDG